MCVCLCECVCDIRVYSHTHTHVCMFVKPHTHVHTKYKNGCEMSVYLRDIELHVHMVLYLLCFYISYNYPKP